MIFRIKNWSFPIKNDSKFSKQKSFILSSFSPDVFFRRSVSKCLILKRISVPSSIWTLRTWFRLEFVQIIIHLIYDQLHVYQSVCDKKKFTLIENVKPQSSSSEDSGSIGWIGIKCDFYDAIEEKKTIQVFRRLWLIR